MNKIAIATIIAACTAMPVSAQPQADDHSGHHEAAPAAPIQGGPQQGCPMAGTMSQGSGAMMQHMGQMQQMMQTMQQMQTDMRQMREQMVQMRQQMQPRH